MKRRSPWLYKRLKWEENPPSFSRPTIWIHALSVGELFSVQRLTRIIKKNFPSYPVVLTVSTQRAFDLYMKRPDPNVNYFTFLPLDYFASVKRFLSSIRPKVALIVESDLWPFLLWELKRRGVSVVVVNGRLSPKSLANYRRFRFIVKPLFSPVMRWLMQSEEGVGRLSATKAVDPAKIDSIGNLKYDTVLDMEASEGYDWVSLFEISEHEKIWVAGSTHPGEEEILLDAFRHVRSKDPSLRLIIGPREIARAKDVLEMAQKRGLRASMRTDVGKGERFEVLVLNTIGELRSIYRIAHVAFVGGSLVPVGGHNILEPAVFGVPVVFGPYMFNFEEVSKSFLINKAAIMVKDSKELEEAILWLIKNPREAKDMGKRGREVCLSHTGATQRLLREISTYL